MLKTGDKAPDFAAQDQDGKVVSLADVLAGGKSVILYFYPKDNTPGCTAEACSLRDGYSELSKKGFVVLGVSADSAASHAKFIENTDCRSRCWSMRITGSRKRTGHGAKKIHGTHLYGHDPYHLYYRYRRCDRTGLR